MPIVIPVYSGKPKREIIELAFEDCGSAGYEFERTPEEVGSALRKLNALMAEWKGQGIDLGYQQPDYGTGLPTDLSGLPDETIHVVAMYLALRIAPQMGKTLAPEQRAALSRSFLLLQAQYARVPTVRFPRRTQRGAGTYPYWDPFF